MQYINTWYRVIKLISLVSLTFYSFSSALNAKWSESDALPDLSAYELSGEIPDLEGKVVLVDFWASWCAPCKASFPAMQEIYNNFKDKGFVILAVSVDSTEKAYQKFVDKSGVTFPLIWDAKKKLVSEAEIEAMPTSMMVDKKGVIRSVHEGYLGKKTKKAYYEEIQNLLAE